MSISYGWEKLHLAVHSLCGMGTQHERLINATTFNLSHINPENDLPEELRAGFKDLYAQLTANTATEGEGRIQSTIKVFDEIQLHKAIEEIISLYDSICRHSSLQ